MEAALNLTIEIQRIIEDIVGCFASFCCFVVAILFLL
jgi:hypothetical protein